jgi:hypothetical protein
MRLSDTGSFVLPGKASRAADPAWGTERKLGREAFEELASRFARLVQADPEFEVILPVTDGQVRFRAVPSGMDQAALHGLNTELRQRVVAGGELDLESITTDGYAGLLLTGQTLAAVNGEAERAWDVIGDEFRGILIDSCDPRLRWDFARDANGGGSDWSSR